SHNTNLAILPAKHNLRAAYKQPSSHEKQNYNDIKHDYAEYFCHKWLASFDNRYTRSEEHTSELQSRFDLECRLLLEKKKFNGVQHRCYGAQSPDVRTMRRGTPEHCIDRRG